jgi:hypothetical protein
MKLYQQHIFKKYLHRDFWFNTDLGKTHKGKTNERGIFIIQSFRENFFYNKKIISAKTSQTYLKSVPSFCLKTVPNSSKNVPRKF